MSEQLPNESTATVAVVGRSAAPIDLKHVVCPQCKKEFRLVWNDYSSGYNNEPQSLIVRSCPSGGIYDVYIECPHCDYEEEL